jgi:ferredoxin
MSEQPVVTLVLDPIKCDGRGMCHDAAPDLVALDEWGYPVLPGGTLRAPITRAQRKAAEDATHACPLLALHIER